MYMSPPTDSICISMFHVSHVADEKHFFKQLTFFLLKWPLAPCIIFILKPCLLLSNDLKVY